MHTSAEHTRDPRFGKRLCFTRVKHTFSTKTSVPYRPVWLPNFYCKTSSSLSWPTGRNLKLERFYFPFLSVSRFSGVTGRLPPPGAQNSLISLVLKAMSAHSGWWPIPQGSAFFWVTACGLVSPTGSHAVDKRIWLKLRLTDGSQLRSPSALSRPQFPDVKNRYVCSPGLSTGL